MEIRVNVSIVVYKETKVGYDVWYAIQIQKF